MARMLGINDELVAAGGRSPRPRRAEGRPGFGEASRPPAHSREPRGPTGGTRLCIVCASLLAPGQIDRPLKLHLLLVITQHARLRHDASGLSDWLKEPPWEVLTALSELVEAGLLVTSDHGATQAFELATDEAGDNLSTLARAYNDPELRQLLLAQVRVAEQEQAVRQAPTWEFLR